MTGSSDADAVNHPDLCIGYDIFMASEASYGTMLTDGQRILSSPLSTLGSSSPIPSLQEALERFPSSIHEYLFRSELSMQRANGAYNNDSSSRRDP